MKTQTKSAVVTGGSRGIGRAICLALAEAGYDLIVNYAHSAPAAEETALACRALGVQAIPVQADIACAEDCARLISTAVESFGRVDVLVNNAGVTRDNLAVLLSENDFDSVVDANLKGAFLCCKAAIRPMMKQRFGRIINIASVVGLRGNAGQCNYAASKAGLIGMSKSLAKELAGRNITVNIVAPGFIETDMTAALTAEQCAALLSTIPAGRAGKAEEVAAVVAFFASDSAAYLTGQVLCVDGGMAV